MNILSKKFCISRLTNFKLWSQIKENSVNHCDSFRSRFLLESGKCKCSRQPTITWLCHCMYNIILVETYTINKGGKESICLAFISFSLGLIPGQLLFLVDFGRASSGWDKPSSRYAFQFQTCSQIFEKRLLACHFRPSAWNNRGPTLTEFYESLYLAIVSNICRENSSVIKM